ETLEGREESAIGEAMGVLCALALVLSGSTEEARSWAERAVRAARVLGARPTELAARSLLAEIGGDDSDLPAPPVVAASVAESLRLRAHAALGSEAARQGLGRAAQVLVAPGLLNRL